MDEPSVWTRGVAVTQEAVDALSFLRDSQSELVSIRLTHRAVQMQLLYELGVLKADDLESWTGEDLNTAIQTALATQSAESSPDTEQ